MPFHREEYGSDNPQEIAPRKYDPLYNPLYVAMLVHYGAVADAARAVDPNRKGTAENAVQHTQSAAFKGRTLESIEAQNTWLAHCAG